jgi:cell division septal protein FtsQ
VSRTRPAGRPLSAGIIATLLSKMLGLAILLGSSSLLYDVASSPVFAVSHIAVLGNRLVSEAELEDAARVGGLNLFWIRRADIVSALMSLPPVESAEVSLELPDNLVIRIAERQPAAVWMAGETPFLVDRDGRVLAAGQPEAPLLVIYDRSGQPLGPGQRVSADAVQIVARLDGLLGQSLGPQQRQYEWSADSGLNVVQGVGPRLVIGNADNLEWKIGAIGGIERYLEGNRITAELIDVRFGDRSFYR